MELETRNFPKGFTELKYISSYQSHAFLSFTLSLDVKTFRLVYKSVAYNPSTYDVNAACCSKSDSQYKIWYNRNLKYSVIFVKSQGQYDADENGIFDITFNNLNNDEIETTMKINQQEPINIGYVTVNRNFNIFQAENPYIGVWDATGNLYLLELGNNIYKPCLRNADGAVGIVNINNGNDFITKNDKSTGDFGYETLNGIVVPAT